MTNNTIERHLSQYWKKQRREKTWEFLADELLAETLWTTVRDALGPQRSKRMEEFRQCVLRVLNYYFERDLLHFQAWAEVAQVAERAYVSGWPYVVRVPPFPHHISWRSSP